MENIQTPQASRIINWLIYGNKENYKTPLKSYGNPKTRLERFNRILKMK